MAAGLEARNMLQDVAVSGTLSLSLPCVALLPNGLVGPPWDIRAGDSVTPA